MKEREVLKDRVITSEGLMFFANKISHSIFLMKCSFALRVEILFL